MNARPSAFIPTSLHEEALLTLSKWQRESEALLLKRLYGEPIAGEEVEDEEPDTIPMIPESDLPPRTVRFEEHCEDEANDRAAGREWPF